MNQDKNENISEITGQFTYSGNPCTTAPCLPGIAAAIQSKKDIYFITIEGKLVDDSFSWNGYTPQPRDQVRVKGFIKKNSDINNKSFLTIEIISIDSVK